MSNLVKIECFTQDQEKLVRLLLTQYYPNLHIYGCNLLMVVIVICTGYKIFFQNSLNMLLIIYIERITFSRT